MPAAEGIRLSPLELPQGVRRHGGARRQNRCSSCLGAQGGDLPTPRATLAGESASGAVAPRLFSTGVTSGQRPAEPFRRLRPRNAAECFRDPLPAVHSI